MSVLVVGLSHRTAPVALLERAAVARDDAAALAHELRASENVDEVVVLSTCNRVELYAEVGKFHAGVAELSERLARHAGVSREELNPHLYVHYDEGAVGHLFSVVCGLDSMVVGESQIIGQVRAALRTGQQSGAAGRVLNELLQHALRVGKRAHTETGIDAAGRSLVGVALDIAEEQLGGLGGRRALIVGAGSMAALCAATLRRRGVHDLTVVNRTLGHAERLAAQAGGRAGRLDRLVDELRHVDLLVSCTGAIGPVVDAAAVRAARPDGRPLVVLDLALPHDVDPAVALLPGVTLVDLELLARRLDAAGQAPDAEAVGAIVAAEVVAFHGWERASSVAPTVVALRSMAADVVSAELARLDGRLPRLDEGARAEVAQTVRRVVDKLLHSPTVRVKELAVAPGGDAYAAALRELFDLDPAAVDEVTGPTLLADAPELADSRELTP